MCFLIVKFIIFSLDNENEKTQRIGRSQINICRFKADLFREYFIKNLGNTQSIAEICFVF